MIDRIAVEEGVACFTTALRDYRGLRVGAISAAGSTDRILPKEGTLGSLPGETALALSERLRFLKTRE